ncbi:MAG: hypothetical protein ACR2GN_09685, partial [Bacteroidia bacterium]
MLRPFISFVFCFISITECYSQNEGNIWVFGDSAAIDFNSGNPVPLLGTGLRAYECSSSISNSNGQLLFYSGSYSTTTYWETAIFNKYHNIIQNGNGIYCNTSSTQGNLLIPFVNDTNLFYLFSHRSNTSIPDHKIYYSVIDQSSNFDSGAVMIKNIPLPGITNMTEHIQAIRHGNGIDWWLVTHKNLSDQFYLYLIDSGGINGPFIQQKGSVFNINDLLGQIKFSPDGNKRAVVGGGGKIDLFDFDRCTGILQNSISMGFPANFISFYSCSFSPNSKVLYVSDFDTLFQFDLTASNIQASKQIIWYDSDSINIVGQHLLGPGGKIYIANSSTSWSSNVYNVQNMNLSVINSPDSLGAACNFQPYSFYLGGRRSFGGLPNIPDYVLGPVEGSCLTSVNELN